MMFTARVILPVMTLSAAFTIRAVAEDRTPASTFPGVLPRPKEYREVGPPVLIARHSETVRIRIAGQHPAVKTGLRDIADRLRVLGDVKAEACDEGARISIEVQDTPPEAPPSAPAAPTEPEGYALAVRLTAEGALQEVAIRGRDGLGGYYGIQTLLQLLDRTPEGITIRRAEVRDWPTFSFRLFKGQCWYYRDNRMFVEWAPRCKWNVFGSCYTDCPDWRNPPDAYRGMIADLCDTARRTGAIRVIQLGNPYMIKEKAIRATADTDVDALVAFFELSLSKGSRALMLCLDDFAYLPKEDAGQFTTLAGANASMTTRFAQRIWAKHPGTYIMVCPPPYWLNANKARGYEWAHEYLRDFCASIPKEIAIVWTGREVTSACHEAADIRAYQALCGPQRRLFLWDNTLKLPPGWGNVFRMNAFLETCKDFRRTAWPTLASFTHGEAGINTYGPGEVYKVPLMTAADYLWNPESYDPQDSLRRALYWFDDNPAVGPLVYRWVNELHQHLFTKRIEFLRAPSAQRLDEMTKLTREYDDLFKRITAETTNGALLATLRPYLRRHTDALAMLADVLAAWDARETDPAAARARLDRAGEALGSLTHAIRKDEPAGDHYGCVRHELEDESFKLLAALRDRIVATGPAGERSDLLDAESRGKLRTCLEDINRWILTLDAGSGTLKGTKDTQTSIFINGNFARTLIAGYRITGNSACLDEAMRWCRQFYGLQQLAITSTLEEGGFWADLGYGRNIYFGDGGTAATAFAIGYRYADEPTRAIYRQAMERYARFVLHGCQTDPQGLGRKAARTWRITAGPDAGAIGCGYYLGHLSIEPYTIATANTGTSFFSELYAITGNTEYRDVALGAVKWLLKIRKPDGELPYVLDGRTEDTWPLDTLSYCTEAFIAADLRLKDPALHALLARELKPTIQWFLARQNEDGSWGRLRSADQQRSPRAVTLLTWYYRTVEADPRIAASIRRYCRFLLDAGNSRAYGVKELVRTTGFAGLTVAELLLPESTF